MTKAQLLAVGSTAELCEVVELGKYWGFRCGHWLPVKVLGLPCARGGTGEIAYAPIDKRGYPYAGGIALRDCQALWGPVKAWGDKPPKVSRRALLEKGVSEFWRCHCLAAARSLKKRPQKAPKVLAIANGCLHNECNAAAIRATQGAGCKG